MDENKFLQQVFGTVLNSIILSGRIFYGTTGKKRIDAHTGNGDFGDNVYDHRSAAFITGISIGICVVSPFAVLGLCVVSIPVSYLPT